MTDWQKDILTDLTEKGATKDAGVKVEKWKFSKYWTE